MNPRRLVLADGHVMLLDAFKQLLQGDYDVVGPTMNGRELLGVAGRLKPDIIVADVVRPLYV